MRPYFDVYCHIGMTVSCAPVVGQTERQKGLLTHTVDPQWKYLATHPRIVGIAQQLLEGSPMIVQM